MDFVLSTGDLIALVAVIMVALGVVWAVARWTKGYDNRLKIIGGKGNATYETIFALVNLLSNKETITTKEFTALFSTLHAGYEAEIKKFEAKTTNPITPAEAQRRQELTAKVNANAISVPEAKELQQILNKELAEAQAANNWLAALAIIFLLGMVVAIVAALTRDD